MANNWFPFHIKVKLTVKAWGVGLLYILNGTGAAFSLGFCDGGILQSVIHGITNVVISSHHHPLLTIFLAKSHKSPRGRGEGHSGHSSAL